MDIKEKISIYYTSLTPIERQICTLILENPEYIIQHSIIEAAQLCHASKSAMLRFAKKLQYQGYSEFKYAMQEYIHKSSQKESSSHQKNTLLYEVAQSFQSTLQSLSELNFDKDLKKIVQDIRDYRYVKVIGIGNSSFCANQLVYSLYSHNKFVDAVTDDVQFTYLANCLNEHYLLIVFSVSASMQTYQKLFQAAKKTNSKIVLITMNNESSLFNMANVVFQLPSHISPLQNSNVLNQIDNRTTLYFFADIISYYYGTYIDGYYDKKIKAD